MSMTEDEVKALCDIAKTTYFSLKSIDGCKFLRQITEGLKLKDNLQWQKLYLSLNPYDAIKRLEIKDPELRLSSDGRVLLQFKPEDITLQKIETALNARIPLTVSMMKHSKRIKEKLTNEFIYKQAVNRSVTFDNTLRFNLDWLPLWNKKGASFSEVCNTNDIAAINSLLGRNDYINLVLDTKIRKELDKLNLPKVFWRILDYVYERYKMYCKAWEDKASPREKTYRTINKSIDFNLCEDPAKNDRYLGMLKMAGVLNKYYNIENNTWRTERCYVSALLYCIEQEVR